MEAWLASLNAWTLIILATTLLLCGLAIWFMRLTIRAQGQLLDTVRFTAYELIRTAQDDVDDLREAVEAAGIPNPRPRYQERLRRMSLTPEQREIESMERFEEAVAKIDKDWGIGQ